MKQHLAKSLLMAGALIASFPLLAQQAQPVQPTQPMQSNQPMQSAQPAQSMPAQSAQAGEAMPMQAVPATTQVAQGAMPAALEQYGQGGVQPMQQGRAPVPADPSLARSPSPAVDPASMSLAPDALGTRMGQRNPFLDGA